MPARAEIGSNKEPVRNTKLAWKPYRPDSEEAKSKTLGYDEQVSNSSPHRATRAAAQLGAPTEASADPFEDKPIKRPFQDQDSQAPPLPMDDLTPGDSDTLPPPREASPALQIDPSPAHREPMELNPPNPMLQSNPSPQIRMRARQPVIAPEEFKQDQQGAPGEIELAPSRRTEGNPQEDCKTQYDKLKDYTLDKLNIDITEKGQPGSDVPFECALGEDPFEGRCWHLTTYTWKASALCHKPLYFEDYKLERYGHSKGPFGCEYASSAAHFFGDLVLLPYHIGIETPCECMYDLGYYRPGDCSPYMCDPFPFSLRGAATAAAGYCGIIALFP